MLVTQRGSQPLIWPLAIFSEISKREERGRDEKRGRKGGDKQSQRGRKEISEKVEDGRTINGRDSACLVHVHVY